MKPIEFFLPIEPSTATSQGAGKRIRVVNGIPMFYKSASAKSAESTLMAAVKPYAPTAAWTGPLRLRVEFCFPWRKSEPKRRLALGRVPHTTRPDCSNLIKMIEDTMTRAGFWADDGQIAVLHVCKSWGDKVGISVEVEAIEL